MSNYDNGDRDPLIDGVKAGLGVILAYIGWKGAGEVWKKRKDISNYFKGKNLVILGHQETGKTTLHNFLRKNELLKKHKRTETQEKVPSTVISVKNNDYSMKIRKGIDIGGTKAHIPEWKELFEQCDICIYTLNTEKVYNDDKSYIDIVYKHLHHINQWKSEIKINQDIFIFGLFADKIDGYPSLSDSKLQNLKILLAKKLRDPFLQASITASDFFFGSLLNKKYAEKLIEEFLRFSSA